MRRREREVTVRNEIEQILRRCEICHLGLRSETPEAPPYVVPVNYGFELGERGELTLYFHGAPAGRKFERMLQEPRVSFVIDRLHRVSGEADDACTYTAHYESVMGTGSVEVLLDQNARRRAMTVVMAQFDAARRFTFSEAILARTAVFRVVVDAYTAKSNFGDDEVGTED